MDEGLASLLCPVTEGMDTDQPPDTSFCIEIIQLRTLLTAKLKQSGCSRSV
jgi:hypothetical protein